MQPNLSIPAPAAAFPEVEIASWQNQTKDIQARRMRAALFARALFNACHSHVFAIKRRKLNTPESTVRNETAKELSVILLFLSGLDLGGATGDENVIDFLFETMIELDRLYLAPAARTLIKHFGPYQADFIRDRICATVKQRERLSAEEASALRCSALFDVDFRMAMQQEALHAPVVEIEARLLLNRLSDLVA